MEAARVAALSGHKVVLAEATAGLGGAIEWCKRAPKLRTVGDIGHWLEQEVYRLGVEVRLSTYVDPDDVIFDSADVVIVATGASLDLSLLQVQVPAHPVRVEQGARVISSIDLLSDRRQHWGRSALVVDEVGHYEAIACVEYLLERGVDVTYLTRHPMFAIGIQPTLRVEAALERLYAKGKFCVVTASQVVKIAAGSAEVKPIRGETGDVIPAETVVWIGIRRGSDEIYRKLRARGIAATCIGDAIAARTLQTAIAEGNAAARSINSTGFAPLGVG